MPNQDRSNAAATPCVLYAAKSTEDKHGSIPTQLEDGRAKAEREGWAVIAECQDEGFSGYHGNRGPGLAEARERAAALAAEHGSAVLLAQHSDRLARGAGDAPGAPEHLAEIAFWARRQNVELRSVQDDDSLTNPLLAFVMGERNMEDSRRKSAAVKAGMKRRAERGQLTGGPRPYGFRWQGPKGEKVPVLVPEEAAIVRRVFAEFLAGRSQQSIQKALNAEGVKTANGGQWYQGTVGKLLANPLYMGCVQSNGEVYEGQHEAIVDAETWQRAAEIREATARTKGGGRGRRPRGGHLFVKGHLRCGGCGEPMVPRTSPNKTGGWYEVYYCFGRKRNGPDFCSQGPVPRALVDGAAFAHFSEWQLDLDATRQRIADVFAGQVAETRALREAAEQDARQTTASLERIRGDYKAGKIEAADWHELRDELTSELAAAEANAERLRSREREIAEGETRDAETETLRYVSELQEAIIGQVRGAEGTDAARAALVRLYEGFTLERVEDRAGFAEYLKGRPTGQALYCLRSKVRESVLVGGNAPKIPLYAAADNEAVGLAKASKARTLDELLFGPVLVPAR